MKSIVALFLLLISCSGAHAVTSCTPPVQWIESYGTFNIGDTPIFGPDCNHIQSGGSSSVSVTSSTLITSAFCGFTIYLSNGFYPVTLDNWANFPANCPLTFVNQDNGNGKQLVNFPVNGLTSPNILWPTKAIKIQLFSGSFNVVVTDGRWKMPHGQQFFMDAIHGVDTNDCLTPWNGGTGHPCASFQQVIRTNIKDYTDMGGQSQFPSGQVIINLADNATAGVCNTTCYGLLHAAFTPVGNEGRGTIILLGDNANPRNVVIADSAGGNIGCYTAGLGIELANLQVGQNNGASGPLANTLIDAGDNCIIRVQGGVYVGASSFAQFQEENGGQMFWDVDLGVTIVGNAAYLNYADHGSINMNNNRANVANPVTYSSFVLQGLGQSYLNVGQMNNWIGKANITGTSWFCRASSVIEVDSGGATIPGSGTGTTQSGCNVF